MPLVVRLGDVNTGGGSVMPGVPTVLTNGQPTVTYGTGFVTPHPICGKPGGIAHCVAKVGFGNPRVLVGGMPIVFVGVTDTCGHSRATGSPNTIVG